MVNSQNNPYFVAYIPVIHRGYLEIFKKYPSIKIGILSYEEVLEFAPYIRKDIRKLDDKFLKKTLKAMGYEAEILDHKKLKRVITEKQRLILPNDDITRALLKKFPDINAEIVPIFLRWDRDNSHESSLVIPDRELTLSSKDHIINLLSEERQKSSNWWRRVAAAVVMNDTVIAHAYNSPLPHEQSSWAEGDPRITARRGESIELSIDIHAEALVIAQCAREGKKLEKSSIYVTTFPCPGCAKLIALAGIKQCYFIEGYASLDGQKILQDFGVEIIKINTKLTSEDPSSLLPYPIS